MSGIHCSNCSKEIPFGNNVCPTCHTVLPKERRGIMTIYDMPVSSFPENHKHFAGIIGLIPNQKDLGPCHSCGQGRIIQFTVGVQQPGAQKVTPHVTGQACNVCGYRAAHLPDKIAFLTERNATGWLISPDQRGN